MQALTTLTLFVILFNFCFCFTATASLLISPTRVLIEDRERSAKVILINTSEEIKTYRIAWIENKALPSGGYKELSKEEAQMFPTASPMIRVSPKQVTLAPGEKQTIKLLARRSKDLTDGEYRSHLSFIALPNMQNQAKEDNDGVSSMKLNLMLSYAIPMILRQGKKEYSFSISKTKVDVVSQKKKTDIVVDISRSGSTSLYGNFKAYWTPKDGSKEVKVGELNSINIYPETAKRTYRLFWQNDDFKNKEGSLRVYFEGIKEYQNIIFDETVIKL